MLIKTGSNGFNHPAGSEITPAAVYANRRRFLQVAAAGGAVAASGWALRDAHAATPAAWAPLQAVPSQVAGATTTEPVNAESDVTSYNNFYEFGTAKGDPASNAHMLRVDPWSVEIEGLVNRPGRIALEDLMALEPLEDRIYRHRCVEAWSMVIPWVGFSLSHLIDHVQPQGSAKYVQFVTLADPAQMPGLRHRVLDWPYTEALRMDEARHPLALLAFGVYGHVLPNQNGAPVRMVLPWKYGFKSAKSIVKIRFVEEQPSTAWNVAVPREYGFYANVNPGVSHPRWSQASERRIGEGGGLFAKKRPTQMFNGYTEQVGQMYAGMDLHKFY